MASIIETVKFTAAGKELSKEQQQQSSSPMMSPSSFSTSNKTVLLVAHAIYLPAVTLGVASLLGCCDTNGIGRQSTSTPSSSSSMIETRLSLNTKEAEGYLIIDAEQRSVQYSSRNDRQKKTRV